MEETVRNQHQKGEQDSEWWMSPSDDSSPINKELKGEIEADFYAVFFHMRGDHLGKPTGLSDLAATEII